MKPQDEDRPKVLVVYDHSVVRDALVLFVSKEGLDVQSVPSIEAAKEALVDKPFDLVITEVWFDLPSDSEHAQFEIESIQQLKQVDSKLPIIGLCYPFNYGLERLDELSALGITIVDKLSPIYLLQSVRNILSGRGKTWPAPSKSPQDAQRKVLQLEDIRRVFSEEVTKLMIDLNVQTLTLPGEGTYQLPKALQGFKKDIERQILRFPFEQNVFLMMKFRPSNRDVADYIIETLRRSGFRAVRADDREWNITRNVYNPIAVLYCCKYGIALFDEPEDHQAYRPNVAYELGIMHQQNKECLILRHSALPQVPFDLIKDLYVSYDRDLQLRGIIERWVEEMAARLE
jgi:DNA-binding response OmpR family regulator